MAPWAQILLWWAAFTLTHTIPSSTRLRPRLIRRLGTNGFLGLYSLLALATFVPVVVIYFGHRHSGALLWNLRTVALVDWGAWALSWAAWTLAIAALVQPSPVSLGGAGSVHAKGITRITRHGLFVGLGLWALAHLALNGAASDVAFFGGFAVFAVVGTLHQDARKRATAPELRTLYRETSVVPFAAIIDGRTPLVASELSWFTLAAACVAAYGLYALHPWLFGS